MCKQKTFYGYLKAYAQEVPEQKLLGSAEGWYTVKEIRNLVDEASEKLLQKGVHAGDLVLLEMEQSVQSVLWLLALEKVGAIAVLIDPREEPMAFLETVDMQVQWLISKETVARGSTTGREKLKMMSGVPELVIFTSGSTGKQKAVVLCQENLISNLLGSASLGWYDTQDVALGALPLYHVFGLALLTGAIVLRHALYLIDGADLPAVLSAVETQKITRMNGVPALYLQMTHLREQYDLSSLKAGFIGGGPCTKEQFIRIEEELGITLISVYGMSECIGISCASYQEEREKRAGGVGKFYPENQGKILLEDGTEAQTGQAGEICVKGPMRMLGYYDEAETKEVIDADGFLHTGDLGYLDADGILHLTGRKKDIIIRNGVNLSAWSIEKALLELPQVEAAAVVGLEDELQGEIPCAMVVSTLGKEKILEALTERLPKNALPGKICLVEQLPCTLSGKPDKVQIREVLKQWSKV